MKLHALITPAFVKSGHYKDFQLIGAKYFLYSFCTDIDKRFILPLYIYKTFTSTSSKFQSVVPSVDDLAIDMLEIIVKNGFIVAELV